jgi:hypothetical protein
VEEEDQVPHNLGVRHGLPTKWIRHRSEALTGGPCVLNLPAIHARPIEDGAAVSVSEEAV